MARSSNVVPVPEEEAPEELAWGTSPRLYLSYGMIAMKGMCPALTDDVEAAPSFTVLSPPMGLDFFAVLDGHGLGAAGGESDRLLALLRDAVAGQVYLELLSDSPRFLDGTTSHDGVVGWWATTLREAFQDFHQQVAACSQGVHTEHTAIVALVLERYLVIANCGTAKAVLSRDGKIVELSSDSHVANKGVENRSANNAGGGRMGEATSKSKLATTLRTTSDASVSLAPAPAPAPAATGVVDVVAVKREPRDEFLILASAAFWDKVTPAAACAHVRLRLGRTTLRVTMPWATRVTDPEGSPTLLAEELARKAVHAGSLDNVSVVLVVFRDFWTAPTRATPSPGAEVPDKKQDEATAGSARGRPKRTRTKSRRVFGRDWANV